MEVKPAGTLMLTRHDLRQLLGSEDYLQVAETAFRAHAEGRVFKPALMHVDADEGEFHIKAGGLRLERNYFALKSNGGFFKNGANGFPPIQGVVLLCDADNGYPLALMDSTAITLGRTAATTAAAARHLARENSHTVTICGCGNQGIEHLRYIKMVRPITKAYAWDSNQQKAEQFAARMSAELAIEVIVTQRLGDAVAKSDICITCTSARQPFLKPGHVHSGLFIAAVGADSPDKQELDPALLASATVVVDIVEQCAAVGELHHAVAAGLMRIEDVHAELGEVLTGRKRGRATDDEVIIFDATGTALQDTAAAAAAYTRALSTGMGTCFDFFR